MLEVLRATIKTGSGSVASVVLMAIASKIMAVVIGPIGIGIYSMLMQLNRTATQAGSIGGGAALVQGLASREGSEKQDYIISVFWIFLCGAGTVAAVLLLFANFISPIALGSDDQGSVRLIQWLSLPVTLAIIHLYVRSVLNGFRAIGRLAIVQTSIAVVNATLAYPVSVLVDSGYPVAFITMMSLSYLVGIIIAVYAIRKEGWIKPHRGKRLRPVIAAGSARHFFSIASVTLITGFLATASILAVRSIIVTNYGLDSAGIFNAAWTIGMVYAMVALTSFSTYYLPTLSQTANRDGGNRLMNQILWVTAALVVPVSILAIVLKPLIVNVLYSEEFLPALEIIRWMLLAAFVKSIGWVLAMPMLAYARMRAYLIAESMWYIGFVILSIISVYFFDSIEGVGAAFLFMYVIYFGYAFYYSTRYLDFKANRRMSLICILGIALVTIASIITWNESAVDLFSVTTFIAAAIAFVLLIPNRRQRQKAFRHIRALLGKA